MKAKSLALITEDRLTEAVFRKCIAEFMPSFCIVRSEVKNGRGNVQRELNAYSALSNAMPVIIGVDLDHDQCAPTLLAKWQASFQPNRNLIIRIAVREIESWVLADRKRIAALISAPSDNIAKDPDNLDDPKIFLLEMAREFAKEDLRRELVPVNFGQYPRIGPAYNATMAQFVMSRWRPAVARKKSDSLDRALRAFESVQAAS